MVKEIILTKLKLSFRNNFSYSFKEKFTVNYMLLFIPLYLFLIYNISATNSIFYTLLCYFLMITGLDIHTISNKSNLNTILIFNHTLDKNKSVLINLLSDYITKVVLLFPILLFSQDYLIIFFLCSSFIIFSFLLKELISVKIIHHRIHIVFLFIYLCFFTLFGGLFLEKTEKTLAFINYCLNNLFEICLIITLFYFITSVILYFIFSKCFSAIRK